MPAMNHWHEQVLDRHGPIVVVATGPELTSARLIYSSYEFREGCNQKLASIVLQIKSKHHIGQPGQSNPHDRRALSWFDVYLERPIGPAEYQIGYQQVEGSRISKIVRNVAMDQEFTTHTVVWDADNEIVKRFAVDDRLVLEARVQHLGHEMHIEWAQIRLLLTYSASPTTSGTSTDDAADETAALDTAFHHQSDDMDDTNTADVLRWTDALRYTPIGNEFRPTVLGKLGLAFLNRYKPQGDVQDLNNAIQSLTEAIKLTADDHPNLPHQMSNLASALEKRYQKLGVIHLDDLNNAIAGLCRSLDHTPDEDAYKAIFLSSLFKLLKLRFEVLGDLTDLNSAISRITESISLTSDRNPFMAVYLSYLARTLKLRFDFLGHMEDFDQAVNHLEKATSMISESQPSFATYLVIQSQLLQTKFSCFGDALDLNSAISKLSDALHLMNAGHPDKCLTLSNLGYMLRERFIHFGDINDLESGINMQLDALKILESQRDLPFHLSKLARSLQSRFIHLHNVQDLEMAFSKSTEALSMIPLGHPDMPTYLSNLGELSHIRYQHFGNIEDLDIVISRYSEALLQIPQGHASKQIHLTSLGGVLHSRFVHLGQIKDLEKAALRMSEAISLTPGDHPGLPRQLNKMSRIFLSRFESLGDVEDLNKAISNAEKAVQLIQEGDTMMPLCLSVLADALAGKFELTHKIQDSNNLVLKRTEAVNACLQDNPDKPLHLTKLGQAFVRRFENFGDICDLETALLKTSEAMNNAKGRGPKSMSLCLSNLGKCYQCRFTYWGNIQDIDMAISKLTQAIDLIPEGHIDMRIDLSFLANSLLSRFQRLGDVQDLQNVVLRREEALQLLPDGHPSMRVYLAQLGRALYRRFEHLGDIKDLDSAISRLTTACQLTPEGLEGQFPMSIYLSNLARFHHGRFEHLGHIEDLDLAISQHLRALQLTSRGHSGVPSHLGHLSKSLHAKFEHLHDIQDLHNALSNMAEALHLAPHGHWNYVRYLYRYGLILQSKFVHSKAKADLHTAMATLKEAACISPSNPLIQFDAALAWARLAASEKLSDIALEAYCRAVRLLPSLAWRGLTFVRRQALLKSSTQIAHEAGMIAIQQGKYAMAVELIEQGRSIFWSSKSEVRGELEQLHDVHPELANKLKTIGTWLDQYTSIDDLRIDELDKEIPDDLEMAAQQYRTHALEWDNILAQVHGMPGFQKFLLPWSFEQLSEAASCGPVVVINIYDSQCDALLIHDGKVEHVPLPDVTMESIKIWQTDMHEGIETALINKECEGVFVKHILKPILQELWLYIVKPIIDKLLLTRPASSDVGKLPHIWWCPTGPLTFLPIHAAGPYRKKLPGVFDYVISSYTVTLSSLINARARPLGSEIKMLAVSQADAPSYLPKLGALSAKDGETIKNMLSSLERQTVHFEHIHDDDATTQRVLSKMKENSWLHLACHGEQNLMDPLESFFALFDHPLKLRVIAQQKLPLADFAFLAACKTATGVTDLPDEAMHLAAGLQLAGFRSQIASLWSVGDIEAQTLTAKVYEKLFESTPPESTQAALAVHIGAQWLRKNKASLFRWVPFIHIGV